MKTKIEIVEIEECEIKIIRLIKSDLIYKLKNDLIGTLTTYDLDDDIIIELIDFIPVDTFLMCYDPSENLIKKLLDLEYLTNDKLENLSLTALSKLSKEFMESKIEYFNFDRVILNYSTQDDEFFLRNDPNFFIEKTNLHGPYFWRILSSNKLPKNIILENLDKFDWLLLTINNSFSDFTEEEFESIKIYLSELGQSDIQDIEYIDNSITDISLDAIEQLINKADDSIK